MKLPNVRKYPKVLHITPEVDYKLQFVRKMKNLDGECDPAEQVLRIRLGQTPEGTFATAVHEILHALSDEYDIKLTEVQVRKLEVALVGFLMMNV